MDLTHTLKCGRWVWKYFKEPYTEQPLTITPREPLTWLPGLAPDSNCASKICCKAGSTHPPTRIIEGFTYCEPDFFCNFTRWFELRAPERGAHVGSLHIPYSERNNGVDPKKCYYTKDLAPSFYKCLHTGYHNSTHMTYTELWFNLTSIAGQYKPKPFIWTRRREGRYCVGLCEQTTTTWTTPQNCSWAPQICFNLTTCGYHKPTQCPKTYPVPRGGLIRGSVNKTLLHDVNLVMAHVSYNISNVLSAYLAHCKAYEKTFDWLQSRIDDLILDYKTRLAVQIQERKKRDLFASVTGLFGTGNSLANTYQITKQSQYTAWLTNQIATGFQHLTSGDNNIIKAVRSEARALIQLSNIIFNQTNMAEQEAACRMYAQDLFTAVRQEILDLRLRETPRHALIDLIELLELHRWFNSIKMKDISYSELLTTVMLYNGQEGEGCIGFHVTFPFIHPDQVFNDATTVRSLGIVVNEQVIQWENTGYMTIRGSEALFTTRACCHETSSYVICTCNTLLPVLTNDTKLINVRSLHGFADAIQVSHTQWCIVSEMNSFFYGGLSCPANHSFCLEVSEDLYMGQLNILGRVPLDTDISPWWKDTFYQESTRMVVQALEMVGQLVRETNVHLDQAQVEVDLARKTARVLSSASTSAQYAFSWWEWTYRACVFASMGILLMTVLQCVYFRRLIRKQRDTLSTALTLGPLNLFSNAPRGRKL